MRGALGIGHLRGFDGEAETIRITGFGKQRLGLVDIVRMYPGRIDIAAVIRRVMAADGRAEAGPGAFNDSTAIHSHHQRLTHALVIEGLAGIVHARHDLQLGIADEGAEARVAIEGGHQFRCAEFREGIDIARFQCGGLRLWIGDETEGRLLQLHRHGLVPIGVVLPQLDLVALGPGHEFERAGADWRGAVIRRAFRRHHHGGRPAEPVEKAAGRLLKLQHQRCGIRRLYTVDGGEEAFLRIDRAFATRPIQRKFRDRGIKSLAIMEGHALAQLERIGLAIRGNFPAFCKLRLYLALAVDLHQTFEDILPGDLTNGDGGGDGRIETGRLDGHAKRQRGFRRGFGNRCRKRQPERRAQCKGQRGTARKRCRLRKISAWHHCPLSGGRGIFALPKTARCKKSVMLQAHTQSRFLCAPCS